MFKGLSGLAQLMKQAQNLQGRVDEIQEKLAGMRVEGSAGGGMVTVEADGQQRLIACRIDPAVLADADSELLEELVVSAVNQAMDKAKAAAAQEMTGALGGVQLPGLDDAMNQLGVTG
jgi:DNA-binding YbaB/EbfC family protein